MTAQTIFLIRHAEKPDDDDNIHLSELGINRARALPKLFGPKGRLSTPQFLIAADKSKKSNRSFETLRPLAHLLELGIDHHFEDNEYKVLAKRIKTKSKYDNSVILIAWHHENIPNFAVALGVPKELLPLKHWSDDVFDHVWILQWSLLGECMIHSETQRLELLHANS